MQPTESTLKGARRFITRSLPAACTLLLLGVSVACEDEITSPITGDGELRVLYIGNSLTYTNDLPGLVATIAEAAGRSIAYGTIARPNFSLEDHWNTGIAEQIQAARADFVVLQQGPSSLPENQEHLRHWSEQLAGPIQDAGGQPVLFMVWPEADRADAFDAVLESYQGAAEAVAGRFAPAGEAWRAAWALDPQLVLYGPDGFHPAPLGSVTAALTIYSVLFEAEVSDLPTQLVPTTPGLAVIDLSPSTAAALYSAVDEVVALYSVGTTGPQ